jgi:hypothetical protein
MPTWAVYPDIILTITLIAAAWRIASTITRIDTNVTEIKDNHLPHIDRRLTRLERHSGLRTRRSKNGKF